MNASTRAVATGAGLLAALLFTACSENTASETQDTASDTESVKLELVKRDYDPDNGKQLFIDKGCVICHSVNGVGGKAGPAMDAQIGAPPIDPLDFAARMWLGAPAMIELQSVELGYTIYLTADDIADLAAFAGDREAQKTLKLDDLPETTRNGLLDEQFWEVENWDEFLRAGREGEIPMDELDEEDDQSGDQPE